MATVLITGGAGYIGKCLAAQCEKEGLTPLLIDNFSTSRKTPALSRWKCHEVDLTDTIATANLAKSLPPIHAIFHLAARALVSESCAEPELYLRNNILSTINVGQLASEIKAKHLIHSSSCAIYGEPKLIPIPENHPCEPMSPYGESKLCAERVLRQIQDRRPLRTLSLRYFNPSGAMELGALGEAHDPETHLIPNVVSALMRGKPIAIYGNDYETTDGTCIRDFLHIEDLVRAHTLALKYLEKYTNDERVPFMNLGAGKGVSVLEVVRTAEAVFHKKATIEFHPRRPGDPPILVADGSLAHEKLRWKPERSLEEMISSHKSFEEKLG